MKEVFVHEEDLPKNCLNCPFVDTSSDFPNLFCNVNCEMLNDTGEEAIDEERHKNCPLKIIEQYKG